MGGNGFFGREGGGADRAFDAGSGGRGGSCSLAGGNEGLVGVEAGGALGSRASGGRGRQRR